MTCRKDSDVKIVERQVIVIKRFVGTEIGKTAVITAFVDDTTAEELMHYARTKGYRLVRGAVGSMQGEKVIAALETAAKREGLIDATSYREKHALYHAIVEAMQGIGRGQVLLGEMLRTVGLTFVIARGPRASRLAAEGDWLAVVLYGTIGAPIKGFEHETLGLGINHL